MMYIKGMIIAVALLGSLGGMNAADAQTMTRTQIDPADKLFRMVAPDGTVIAADGVTKRFFIETSAGQSFEFTFEQALAHAEQNPAKRATLRADFEGALAHVEMANYSHVYLLPPTALPPVPCRPRPGEIVCEITANNNASELMAVFADEEEDEEDPPFDLDEVSVTGRMPTSMQGWSGLGGWGYFPGGSSYSNPDPLGSYAAEQYQKCAAKDYEDFQKNRAGACATANLAKVGWGSTTLLAGKACLASTVTTVGAAIACGVGAISVVVTLYPVVSNELQCRAEYTKPTHC